MLALLLVYIVTYSVPAPPSGQCWGIVFALSVCASVLVLDVICVHFVKWQLAFCT